LSTKLSFLLLLTFCFIQPASTQTLEEVVINAARIPLSLSQAPFAVDKLEREQIIRAQTQLGLDESLVGIPGLVLQNRFNFAQDLRISIRGFGARANFGIRGVKILVDGIPETLADGQGGIDSIDLTSIGSIEVLRGPSSSLYGNASGGVIRIESDFDRSDTGIEARLAIGGNGYRKNQVHINGESDNQQLSYIASISRLDIEGYRNHSEHKNTLFNARMRYTFKDDGTLKIAVNHTDQPQANDPGGVSLATLLGDRTAARDRNVALNAGEALEQTRIGIIYQRDLGKKGKLSIRNYHIWRDFEGRIPITNNGVIDIARYYSGGGLMYQHQNILWSKESTSIFGMDYDYQDDSRERFENLNGISGNRVLDQREKVTSAAVYLQNQLQLSDRWLLNSGIRYDEISFTVDDYQATNSGKRSLNQLSPMIATSYALNHQTSIYANISTSFETPTTTELALVESTGLNTQLDAQEAVSYELGIKGNFESGLISASRKNQQHQYTLSVFSIDVEQEIIALEDNLGRDVFINAGESSRQGIELSIKSRLSDTISSSLAYTYSDFSYKTFIDKNNNNFSGNRLPGLPQNTLHVAFNYQHPSGLFATLETLYLGPFELNNGNTVSMDSSLVTDFRGGYNFAVDSLSIEPFIGISNLFNEVYSANARINAFGGRFYESGPDRNLYAGVSIRHNFNH
jgi:iron complex outermembrane receptor protein